MFHRSNQTSARNAQASFVPQDLAGNIYVLLHDVVSILAAITVCFVFFARLVMVSDISMSPTLIGAPVDQNGNPVGTMLGDHLVLRSNFLCAAYDPGDIVVACIPQLGSEKPLIKRVIACGGQTVCFRTGEDGNFHVWVDDVLQSEAHILEPMTELFDQMEGQPFTVPEGFYFLMGDNRNYSLDSRTSSIGMVDGRYILGKALCIAFPGKTIQQNDSRNFSRIGLLSD